ncbi:membrane protein [Bombiscardovia apis]|uniref:Membrane protein n=1 Tax=Bombiscardovia apis TaxID=2932182 RepID=A0ABM8BCG9_9BIFI|nr:phage holin family protein [Bombiscardovia apis]BDR54578.1 membrane protein [Bombiscardovia apis]
MNSFLSRWLVMTISVGVMVLLLPGMTAVGKPPIFGIAAFALFMALINASIKPLIRLLTMPLTIVTFGIFSLLLNWFFMSLSSWLAIGLFGVGVHIRGFLWSILGSIIISIVNSIVTAAMDR